MKIRLDFVTNSSSDAFICHTNDSPAQVENEIKKILAFYNDLMHKELTFEDVFCDPHIGAVGEFNSYLESWDRNNQGDLGKTVIHSASDNTIPSMVMRIIEERFDSWQIHLG